MTTLKFPWILGSLSFLSPDGREFQAVLAPALNDGGVAHIQLPYVHSTDYLLVL